MESSPLGFHRWFAAMGRSLVHSQVALPSATAGPLLIAVGLAGLLASASLPAVPVVTAMAILSLGATDATLARFRHSPALVPIMLLHAATYTALYGLFVGATLHAAATSAGQGVNAWAALDLAVSTLPMAFVIRHTRAMLSGCDG
jgi:hypothetical protein